MDPDQALKDIRHYVNVVERDGGESAPATADALVESFRALDDWLSTGGFLPSDWQRREISTVE